MARLIVEARGTGAERPNETGAAAGNSHPIHVVVSVTDTNGLPVTGLTGANFTIKVVIMSASNTQVKIASVGGFEHGDYLLDLFPVSVQGSQYLWALGRYIFLLVVTHDGDRGQTLCDVLVH
jgi:hypothetical protein